MHSRQFLAFLLVFGILVAPYTAYGQESSAIITIKNTDSIVYVDEGTPPVLFSVDFVNFPRDNKISARVVEVSTGDIVHEQLLNTNSIPTGTDERLDNLAVPLYKIPHFFSESSFGEYSLQVISEHGAIMGKAGFVVTDRQPAVQAGSEASAGQAGAPAGTKSSNGGDAGGQAFGAYSDECVAFRDYVLAGNNPFHGIPIDEVIFTLPALLIFIVVILASTVTGWCPDLLPFIEDNRYIFGALTFVLWIVIIIIIAKILWSVSKRRKLPGHPPGTFGGYRMHEGEKSVKVSRFSFMLRNGLRYKGVGEICITNFGNVLACVAVGRVNSHMESCVTWNAQYATHINIQGGNRLHIIFRDKKASFAATFKFMKKGDAKRWHDMIVNKEWDVGL